MAYRVRCLICFSHRKTWMNSRVYHSAAIVDSNDKGAYYFFYGYRVEIGGVQIGAKGSKVES